MKQILVIVVGIVLMAISGGVGYYLGNDNGLRTAQNIRAEFLQQRLGAQTASGGETTVPGQPTRQAQQGITQRGGTTALLGGRPTANGTVKSVQGNTITVTQADGSSATVTVDDKTTIQKLGAATLADVQAGLRIIVSEQSGAKQIQLIAAE
jgi:hypothetical protein